MLLSVCGSAFAQEWAEYQNIQDGFKIDFPGQPKVTTLTWKSEHGFMLPARVYSVDRGKERYSVTVVDYSGIEQMGIERAKSCPPGAEPCLGSDLAGIGLLEARRPRRRAVCDRPHAQGQRHAD